MEFFFVNQSSGVNMKNIVLIISILLVILIFIMYINKNKIEKYESIATDKYNPISSWDLTDNMRHIGDCYNYSGLNCLKYSNCGLADGKCIPGDYQGPYYKTGTQRWIYRDKETNKVKKVRPFDHISNTPDYPYPQNNNFVGI